MKFTQKLKDKYNKAVARTKNVGIGTAVGVGVATVGIVAAGSVATLILSPISIPLIAASAIAGGVVGYKID